MTPSRLVWKGGIPEPTLPLKHFLTHAELDSAIARSRKLSAPVVRETLDEIIASDQKAAVERHIAEAATAETAIRRITNLANGSAADRTSANKARCVAEFGRHETDQDLRFTNQVRVKERGGPDTGSSEVQIAILTVKIRALADALERGRGKRDKMNKRNLRLMVHKRQKLLKYLMRKEKEGPRWQHCIKKLGLTPGAWEGEISL
jgi:ribosomal protein S15